MQTLTDFVSEHINDDITALILGRDKWPDMDMDLAVNCIESRRKLKGKIPQWHDMKELVFPLKLSAEQCSGSDAALYKACLAERIASEREWKIADLTGGLGADSWFFSQKASEVLYCEMQKPLCDAAIHNFRVLGAGNIAVMNRLIGSENTPESERADRFATPGQILSDFRPDIVYMDPARRSGSGKKVFLIEECTPDVLTLKDEIFRICPHILLKLSPMADITMACGRLGKECREVHVVSVDGECKELLIWMDREWAGEYTITATELKNGGSLTFLPSEEKAARATIISAETLRNAGEGKFLFEPGKALMKAGAFNTVCAVTGMEKLGISTHYYIGQPEWDNPAGRLGKIFMIIRCVRLDKKSIRQAGIDFPGADITARNLPADTMTMRKKMDGVRKKDSGTPSDIHIFCLKSDKAGALLIVGKKVLNSGAQDEAGQAQPSQD